MTERLVKYFERIHTPCGSLVFKQMVADFVKNRKGEWVFIQVKSFRLTESCLKRCKAYGRAQEVSMLPLD